MSWTHLREEYPVGRKEHTCYLCNLKIPKGEKHVARTGINDDGPYTFRMHIECEKLSRNWHEEDWEVPVDHNEFRRELAESLTVSTTGRER